MKKINFKTEADFILKKPFFSQKLLDLIINPVVF